MNQQKTNRCIIILIDFNQILYSSIFSLFSKSNVKIDKNIIRHVVLNCIRSTRIKYKDEYDEIVIVCDSPNCWRKDIFPYYKFHRKTAREKFDINWNSIFSDADDIKKEIQDFMPYKLVQVEKAEADDIIAVLVKKEGNHLIVSGDNDFIQLHSKNVAQYNPLKKIVTRNLEPKKYLQEKIIRGDSGDGIPNIKSPDDCFVNKKRQSPIFQEQINKWIDCNPEDFCDVNMLRRYYRNETLINLSKIPEILSEKIQETYDSIPEKNRSKIFQYFISSNLNNLMESIQEF